MDNPTVQCKDFSFFPYVHYLYESKLIIHCYGIFLFLSNLIPWICYNSVVNIHNNVLNFEKHHKWWTKNKMISITLCPVRYINAVLVQRFKRLPLRIRDVLGGFVQISRLYICSHKYKQIICPSIYYKYAQIWTEEVKKQHGSI